MSILSEDELLCVRVVFEGAAVMKKGLCADFWVVDRLQSISVAWKLRIELVPSCEVKW